MVNSNKYFTRNNIMDIINIFEDFLERYDVRIPESDKGMVEDGWTIEDNQARIYGLVCMDLEGDLLDYFEKLEKDGTISHVVNSWDDEVEMWDDEMEIWNDEVKMRDGKENEHD